MKKTTSWLAITSLILGITSFIPFLGVLLGIVAIILGIVAFVKINSKTTKGKILSSVGIILGIIGIVFTFIVFNYISPLLKPTNEKIMYGYTDYDDYLKTRPEQIKKIDEDFINYTMNNKDIADRADAAQQLCETGMSYLGRNDYNTAIKRYNQAWLLDHQQPCIYDGYGYYLGNSPQTIEDSFAMFEKAISLSDPTSENDLMNPWWIYSDYAETLDRCYLFDNTRTDCLEKALEQLDKSLEIKDNPQAHRVLAFVYYDKKNYKESWKQLHLAVDGGMTMETVQPFINKLKKEMPDPQGKY